MMTLRNLKIGKRLALGCGLCLASAALLLLFALRTQQRSEQLLTGNTARQAALLKGIADLRAALLDSAIAVRNMGMETELTAAYRQQAEAKKHRESFLTQLTALKARVEPGVQRDALEAPASIDAQHHTAAGAGHSCG